MSDQIAEPVEPEVEPVEERVEGEEALADAGKKALDAMKAERNAARLELRTAKAERDALKLAQDNAGKPAEELALTEAEKRGEAKAKAAANARVFKSELKSAATGKLADPADALAFINSADFEVNDNGDFESGAFADAITALLAAKPHLAANKAPRFVGSGDGGAGAPAKPNPTLDDQIAAARAAGNWKAEMALQNSKLPDQPA